MTAYEDFVVEEVKAGATITGLYPRTKDENLTKFNAWRARNGRQARNVGLKRTPPFAAMSGASQAYANPSASMNMNGISPAAKAPPMSVGAIW